MTIYAFILHFGTKESSVAFNLFVIICDYLYMM